MASFKPRVDKIKLYMTLSVPFNANQATIKSCYKRLALKYHPDRHTSSSKADQENATRQFQEISTAFEVLGDPAKRAAYDEHGMPGVLALETKGNHKNANSGEPAEASSGGNDDTFDDNEQQQAWARAFETYRKAFGNNPVTDVPRGKEAADQPAVHNMAAQREGGSYDEYQKQRLASMFSKIDVRGEGEVGGATVGHSEDRFTTSSSRTSAADLSGISGAKGSGRYAGAGWHH